MPIEHHTISPLGLFSTAILSIALCYVPFTGLLTPASPPPPCPHALRHQVQEDGLLSARRRLGRSSSTNSNITMEDRQETTLNIPSLVIFGLLSFLAIRYFFFAPATSSSSQAAYPAGQRSRARQVSPEKIDLVANMFPQLDRRRIEWDLVRNGGSVQATTEKVLREGRLDEPPPNFRAQPAPAAAAASGAAGGSSASRGRAAAKAPSHTDLITRYNLSSKLSAEQAKQIEEEQQQEKEQQQEQRQGWSANKADRQALLRQRRDAMVLAARRKMEAKLQGEQSQPKA